MRRAIGLLANVFVFVLPSMGSGATISLYPISDRSAEDRPNVNTGALHDGLYDTLFDDADQYLETFRWQATWEMRAALEFDMRSLPAEARIVSASLLLQTAGLGAHTFPTRLLVDGYSGNGMVELADFSALNPVGFAELSTPRQLPLLLVDASPFVQSLHEVGGEYAGFVLRTVHGASIAVASNETTYTSRPRLDIEYEMVGVPEPSVIHLAAIGVLVLYWRRYKMLTKPVDTFPANS